MLGLLLTTVALSTAAPDDAGRATFRPTAAVATASIRVRIVEAGTIDFGGPAVAGQQVHRHATLILDGQRTAATLVEFP